MTPGAEADRSRPQSTEAHHSVRRIALVLAGLLVVVWLVPPLASWARRYEFVEALQFSFLAIVIPALAGRRLPLGPVGPGLVQAPTSRR